MPSPQTAESVEVRLVIDSGVKGEPSEMKGVMSLMAAIRTSQELGLDLMGISLEQDTPVVKAVNYEKLLYEKKKSDLASGSAGKGKKPANAGGPKAKKEFKFKAGIADNDLLRKAENMIKYLLKGHPCQVTITSNRRNLMEDKNAIVTTLDRVRDVVGDNALEARALKKNERGSYGSLLLQPNLKKKKA